MSYLNLAALRLCTESEGPGKRMAIWVQGCERRCPCCCNIEMQEIKRNIVVDTDDLIRLIENTIRKEQIEGVSFIGGEPILQAEGLAHVAKWCQFNGITVLMFTGYYYEELKKLNDDIVNELVGNIDILVDGPFCIEQYDDERDWVGSTNQNVILLTDKYYKGIEYEKKQHSMEIMISDEDILVNGWPFDIL